MRSFIIFFLLSTLCFQDNAQNLSQQVLAPAGLLYRGGGYQCSWTAGELAVSRLTSSGQFLTQGFHQGFGSYGAYGLFSYLNVFHSPMNNSEVFLLDSAGILIDSACTREGGSFYLFRATSGMMTSTAVTDLDWGGVNATDALLVLKHFAGIIQLQQLFYTAADVDLSGNVNSIDALMIARRFTGLINGFPAGDWVFTHDTLPAGTRPVYFEPAALCTGDVNGSYVPGLKTGPSVGLEAEGILAVSPGARINIPLNAAERVNLCAFSLVLGDFSGYFTILDVRVNCEYGNLCWKACNDQLRIAWWSDRPLILQQGLPFIFVEAACTGKEFPPEGWRFRPGHGSELADPEGNSIDNVMIRQPKIYLINNGDDLYISQARPNPARQSCVFSLFLPEKAQIMVRLNTAEGASIMESIRSFPTGSSECSIDLISCCPGLYIASFEVQMADKQHTCVRKIILLP